MGGTGNVLVRAAPSLALVKYWGKSDGGRNLPATSSLAVTVTGLYTEVCLQEGSGSDHLSVDGSVVPVARHAAFFDAARATLGVTTSYRADASNNFPGAAGLASSASLFAALALGSAVLDSKRDLSRTALGSWLGSARHRPHVPFGVGFSTLEAGAECAGDAFPEDHWSELRLLVAITSRRPKPIPSRDAMLHVAVTSPYYPTCVSTAEATFQPALGAVRTRDMQRLGPNMRVSYLRMFGSMFAADPPINYLLPKSLRVLEDARGAACGGGLCLGDHGRRPAGQDRLLGERRGASPCRSADRGRPVYRTT